jgi:hypothetical protein
VFALPLTAPRWLGCLLAAALSTGCATRAVDVQALPSNPADFLPWSCARIHDEMDLVQQRAAQLSWTVDERAGQHVVALGIGLAVFWPALLAMRPDGADAEALARLKGRFEALQSAARQKGCPPPPATMPPERAAAMPVLPGERMVYEDRTSAREPLREQTLTMTTLRRDEIEFLSDAVGVPVLWRQDLAGNVIEAPPGALVWRRLLRRSMALGDVLAGDIAVSGDALLRARVRGQVVAVGPQSIAGRAFDVAVIELFGDVPQGETSTRLDGAIVVDRSSGLLLRLDLRSAQPLFQLQRRLVRVDVAR